ncbi:MAG: hypothetical protein GY811_11310 [Myxococcales bacterium]|nr:hypothetical protein [Myxococcales bacterium]
MRRSRQNWADWDSLQQRIASLADQAIVDEDLASASQLAADLARRAGHYRRARWAYDYSLGYYERMDKPDQAQIVQLTLADLG